MCFRACVIYVGLFGMLFGMNFWVFSTVYLTLFGLHKFGAVSLGSLMVRWLASEDVGLVIRILLRWGKALP